MQLFTKQNHASSFCQCVVYAADGLEQKRRNSNKRFQNLLYMSEHRWFVLRQKYIPPLKSAHSTYSSNIGNSILVHMPDLSVKHKSLVFIQKKFFFLRFSFFLFFFYFNNNISFFFNATATRRRFKTYKQQQQQTSKRGLG